MKNATLGKILLILCLSAACLGCSAFANTPVDSQADSTASPVFTQTPALENVAETTEVPSAEPSKAVEREISYNVWIPYWDYAAAIDELDQLGEHLDSAICFGAIFDAQDKLLLLPDMQQALSCLNLLYSGDHTIYLSVVNDIEVEKDVYNNKSPELLWRLLGSDDAMEAHIEDLMATLHATGAGGLEIDYEAIQSDVALWQRFVIFIEQLYTRTQSEGYPLRVVLGWNSAKYATFPDGPQYSIMCYNLYGTHSGPGPKADRNFLQDVFTTNDVLPGQPSLAFATGGFDWGDDSSVVSLTQSDAIALREKYGVSAEDISRDCNSAVLNFYYFDEEGSLHEVWYADGDTLAFWRSLALDAGYASFDLFRLGGNSSADLSEFLELSSYYS